MSLAEDILQVRGFAAHGRAEVYDLTVNFFAIIVYKTHGLNLGPIEKIVDFVIGNIFKQ